VTQFGVSLESAQIRLEVLQKHKLS
jgi:hypothetical protein